MNKVELESKHISELHTLAAEAGVPKYRMLRREELIEALADGGGSPGRAEKPARERGQRKPRERRERAPRRRERPAREDGEKRPAREERPKRETAEKKPEPAPAAPAQDAPSEPAPAAERPRRRRRRFGRKRKGVGATDLLLPPPGRQALVYGESREACTAMLREIAAELSGGKGPDPIALLVDPSPEELAEWKRVAPQAELVAAAQARHAADALAQAVRRAESGEDVILLVDSLTKLEDADAAKEIFDGGLNLQANGSLTVVVALERAS